MAFKTASLAALGAFATKALAHGTVSSFSTDGQEHGGFLLDYYYQKINGGTPPAIAAWSAENLDNGFIDGTGYQTADINCHKNAAPGALTETVSAGGTVDFQWTVWPDSHFGPVFTYVAKCDGDCAQADKTTLKWVKIDEAGINLDTQVWAATDLIKNGNKWTTTVPATLAPGNYVFRHEIIALHSAGNVNGAQNYPQCFNIAVTGSGTENPEGVLGTELYKADDPGLFFNPYTTITSYTIPGPALFGSGSSSGGGSGSGSGTSPDTPAETPQQGTPTPSAPAATPQPDAPAASAPAPTAEADAPASSPPVATPEADTAAPEATAAPATGNTGSGSGCGGRTRGGRTSRRHARALN